MPTTTLRVLLVEDDEDDYLLVRDYLSEASDASFTLEWVPTYEAGLAALACRTHDVALIDYRLGARSGLDLLLAARTAGHLPPAIVLTGAGDPSVDAAAQVAGASDYLVKGRLDAMALERAIRYSLDRARQRAALTEAQGFLQATLDALAAHITVVDEQGKIIAVNAAWRRFAAENGYPDSAYGLGMNYLAVCDAAARDEIGAAEVATAIREVLAGQRSSFEREDPCHSPTSRRWFAIRVTRFAGDGPARAVVAHEDITARRLAEERMRFQAHVLDQVPAAVITTDAAGVVTNWNAHATTLYGWAPEEALGRSVTALTVGPTEIATSQAIMGHIATGEIWTGEFPVRRKDGTSFPAYVTDATIRDEHGRPVGLIGVSVDISARKQAEEALQASEQDYRELLEQAADAILIFDPDGRFLKVNAQACKLTGYAREELMRRRIADIMPLDEQDTIATRLAQLQGGPRTSERLVRRQNGTIVPTEVSAARLDDGRVQVIIRDNSERKAAETALRASEARLAEAQRIAHLGSWEYDFSTEQHAWSDECFRIGGFAPQAFTPTFERLMAVVHPDDRERVLQAQSVSLEPGGIYAVEHRIVRPDGEVRVVHQQAETVRDAAGRAVRRVGIVRDITDRKVAETALRESAESFESLLHGTTEGIVITQEGLIVAINRAYTDLLGYESQDVVGRVALDFVVTDDRATSAVRISAHYSQPYEVRQRRKDGSLIATEVVGRPIRFHGRPARLTTVRDITERKALEAQLAHQAFHDSLTGLPNRALFFDRLGQTLFRTQRDGSSCAVIFLDLDRFKDVNDTLGHDMGDQLLIAVATRLRDCLREGDTLARLGGDEFVVLLEGTEEAGEAARVATRIIDVLTLPIALGGREYRSNASLGIALGRDDHARPEEMLRDADIAMYRVKAKGGGGYAIFDPAMQVALVARLDLERDLQLALERNELTLHYQPIVDLQTGRIDKVEALVRWQHPTRGLVPPSEFIPLAEETGQIVPLGRWVLAEACHQAWAWRWAGTPVAVAVNLTAREFQRPTLADEIAAALAEAQLAPAWLRLEITESLAMHDATATVASLAALRALGVQVAIDDFGTGYSSLAYLKRLPVDALKIDKAFVDGLDQDASDTAIVMAIIAVAHTLGLIVVAEGVETAAQAAQLRALGCDLAQGYHFARPLPANELMALLSHDAAGGAMATPDSRRVMTTSELIQRRSTRARHLLLPVSNLVAPD